MADFRDSAADVANSPVSAAACDSAAPAADSVLLLAFSPQALGRSLARRGVIATAVVALTGFAAIAAAGYGVALLDDMVTYGAGYQEVILSPTAVVRAWNERRSWSPGVRDAFAAVVVAAIAVAVVTWAYFPLLHRHGRIATTLRRGFICGCAGLGPAALIVIGIALSAYPPASRALRSAVGISDHDFPIVVAIPVTIALFCAWLARVLRGARCDSPDIRPPTCESCAYDLTHRAPEERCPECGAVVGASTLGLGRAGVAYEMIPRRAGWLATVGQILWDGAVFYRRLRVRSDDAAAFQFARTNAIALGAAALLEAWLMFAILAVRKQNPPDLGEAFWFLFAFALGVGLGCWAGWRIATGVVGTWWLFLKAVPDYLYVRKVFAYESAYLWVYGLAWSAIAMTFVFWDDWLSRLFGRTMPVAVSFFRGMPPEVGAVLGVTILLSAIWWWRFERAMRLVRWANF